MQSTEGSLAAIGGPTSRIRGAWRVGHRQPLACFGPYFRPHQFR